MAKNKELRKIKPKKKKSKVILIVIIILLILSIAGVVGYKYLSKKDKKKVEVKILDSIDKYGYYINDRDNKLYKDEFNKLKEILNEKEIDSEKYSEEVARLFIIDLYSLKGKVNKYDVGGKAFYNSSKSSMYENKVIDTLYANLIDDSYGDRVQELPDVSSIETVSINEDSYIFIEDPIDDNNKKTCIEGFTISKNDHNKCVKEVDKVYVIELKWEYSEDMGYDDEGSLVVAPDVDNKWSVVEYKPRLGAYK